MTFHCAECIRERQLSWMIWPAGKSLRLATENPGYFSNPNALLAHYVDAHPRVAKTMPWLNVMREALSQPKETA